MGKSFTTANRLSVLFSFSFLLLRCE